MMTHLDTSILAEIARNIDGRAARTLAVKLGECAISMIVVAEVRFGLAKKPEARTAVRSHELLEMLTQEPWDAPADKSYAQLRCALEAAGTPIGGNDMLIAAHALARDATLVTANEREFRRVPGLRVENWAA
jgi:tRNA(fMet)-specific endonuclease VapC